MNEYLDKIKQEIEKNKSDIIAELDNLDFSMLSNINSNILLAEKIIDQLTNRNEIDFSIISSILGLMPQYKIGKMVVSDSEEYRIIYEMLKKHEKNNEGIPGFFDDDIAKYSKVFSNLTDEIKKFIINKKNEYNEINTKKREFTEKLKEIRSIGIIIDKYTNEQVILSDEIQKLYTYLMNENEKLNLEEKFDFYRTFSQINTERISAKLNESVTENVEEQVEETTEEIVTEDSQIAQIEEEIEQINNAGNQDIVEDNNENSDQNISENNDEQTISEEELLNLIGNENLILYKKSQKLIEQYKSQLENVEIECLMPTNNSVERRKAYEVYSYDDFDRAEKCILVDIENNILPKINEDLSERIFNEELFEELNFAYNKFQEVVTKEQEKILKEKKEKINYMDILVELQMTDVIDLCNNIESLLTEYNTRSESDLMFKNAICQFSIDLRESFEDFIDYLKNYYFKRDDNNLKGMLFDVDLPILKQKYEEFITAYNFYVEEDVDNKNTNKDKEYIDTSLEFYDKYNNVNYISFVCDISGTPYIEKDINESRKITRKSQALGNVIHKLEVLVNNDEYEIESGHDVKTSYYPEALKKEFQIRSSTCGSELRIFCSKFSTRLNEIFPGKYEKNPSLIFVYEVGYGATDKEKKNEINQIAYKRCYEKKDEIRKIRDLFNTDISNCTEEEKQNIRNKIQDCIREQNIKLGHLIVEEENAREKRKEVGGVE